MTRFLIDKAGTGHYLPPGLVGGGGGRVGGFSAKYSNIWLIAVLSISSVRCPIKHNKGRKLKRGPKGQANLGGSRGMVPQKILKL